MACDDTEVDVGRERLAAGVNAEDRLAPGHVRGRHQHLSVEATRSEQRGVEILEAVRRGHDDDLVACVEAVELDEELVQRLVVLAVEAAAEARGADGVELVDEDDRGRVLARLLEELPDPRSTEAGEHLDERRGALRVEVRSRRARDGLREQRLARARRPVQEDPAWHARAEALEALAVAEELDDLLQLRLGLVEPRHVRPGHLDLRPAHDRRRLRTRHELQRVEKEEDDDPEEHDREPRQERVLEVHHHAYRQRARRAVAGSEARLGGFALEHETRVARGVRDLELVARRLGGREVALELESRAGERTGDGVGRVAGDPREDLDGAADRSGSAHEARRGPAFRRVLSTRRR